MAPRTKPVSIRCFRSRAIARAGISAGIRNSGSTCKMKWTATLPAPTYVSPEEYLERERKAETRSEYIRGEIFAMAGASVRHAAIITNLVIEIGAQLRTTNCSIFSTDLRLAVNRAGVYTYPDVMVVCGNPASIDDRRDTISNPVLIIEVLSP